MKKLVALGLGFALLASFASCGSTASSEAASAGSASMSDTATAGEAVRVGVIQLAPHPALDAALEGFVEGLAENGFVEGENLTLDVQNAQGEISNCPTIASTLVNDGNDLIFAIATPAAQAAANETSEVPIVATAVTDFVESQLVQSNEAPGGNVTGASDLTPIYEQMQLLQELVPDVQTVGILYNSSEANSLIQADIAKEAAAELGFEIEEYTVSSTNDIQSVVTSMVGNVDAIYSPTDNLIANAVSTVATLARDNQIPYIAGEEALVEGGALATVSINYHDLGRVAGKQAADILSGVSQPGEMPIEFQDPSDVRTVANGETAELVDVVIPEDMEMI